MTYRIFLHSCPGKLCEKKANTRLNTLQDNNQKRNLLHQHHRFILNTNCTFLLIISFSTKKPSSFFQKACKKIQYQVNFQHSELILTQVTCFMHIEVIVFFKWSNSDLFLFFLPFWSNIIHFGQIIAYLRLFSLFFYLKFF